MSIFSTISRFAIDYRARRRRLAAYMEITGLPPEIQKDIGWPDPGAEDQSFPRIRQR